MTAYTPMENGEQETSFDKHFGLIPTKTILNNSS